MLTEVLNEKAKCLALETGFIKRVRKFDGADFAQSLIFGWWQEPDLALEGLCQIFGRRDVDLSAPGLSQRFTPESAEFFRHLLEELSAYQMRAEESVPTALLRRFQAVILEDSTVISLPQELSVIWKGCGGHTGTSDGAVKLYVRWDVLSGHLDGPRLTDARCNDRNSPFPGSSIPAGALYLADLGFFGLLRLQGLMQRQGRVKGYVITRLLHRTNLYLRTGHLLELQGVLPKKVGEAREMGVLVGKIARVPMRLILVRVPKKVGNQRRTQLTEDAKAHRREPSEEILYLADWTILLTNVPRRMLSLSEVLVMARLRWQIERLFRLWKEYGKIDEWRSEKPYRILTELYAKLCAMVIQQWLLHHGCWDDPHRSLFKAAQLVRREANRLMVALVEGAVASTLTSILHLLHHSGVRLTRRKTHPGTDQLHSDGLDWPITVLT